MKSARKSLDLATRYDGTACLVDVYRRCFGEQSLRWAPPAAAARPSLVRRTRTVRRAACASRVRARSPAMTVNPVCGSVSMLKRAWPASAWCRWAQQDRTRRRPLLRSRRRPQSPPAKPRPAVPKWVRQRPMRRRAARRSARGPLARAVPARVRSRLPPRRAVRAPKARAHRRLQAAAVARSAASASLPAVRSATRVRGTSKARARARR